MLTIISILNKVVIIKQKKKIRIREMFIVK